MKNSRKVLLTKIFSIFLEFVLPIFVLLIVAGLIFFFRPREVIYENKDIALKYSGNYIVSEKESPAETAIYFRKFFGTGLFNVNVKQLAPSYANYTQEEIVDRAINKIEADNSNWVRRESEALILGSPGYPATQFLYESADQKQRATVVLINNNDKLFVFKAESPKKEFLLRLFELESIMSSMTLN